jgi:FMN reductase (NADPH)
MATPTIELIQQHRSVRSYKPDPIPEGWLEEIVAAAQRTSSSSNLQAYSVIVTTDPEKKAKIKDICSGQAHIAQAPVFLLWCADFSRLKRVCEHQGYEIEAGYMENFMVATVDAAITMQTAALAAESLGLGVCYIGALRNDPEAIGDIFQLPELVYPVCGMTLGWTKDQPLIKPRLALEAVLHREAYQTADLPYLLEYDQVMIDTGIYGGRQVDRQDRDPADYGWMEHTARRTSKPSRPGLKKTIMQAGFQIK